jgi:hypothetical protein
VFQYSAASAFDQRYTRPVLLQAFRRRVGNDEAVAWGGLVANLLVLPGLGSLLVGRRVGWIQAALAVGGFVLTLVWLVSFLRTWISLGEFPLDAGPEMGRGLYGIALFAVAWLWSLGTSLHVVWRKGGR